MIERRGDGPVPLLLGFFSGPQKIEESATGAADDAPSADAGTISSAR